MNDGDFFLPRQCRSTGQKPVLKFHDLEPRKNFFVICLSVSLQAVEIRVLNLYQTKRLKKVKKEVKQGDILIIDEEKSRNSSYYFVINPDRSGYLFTRKFISGFGQVLRDAEKSHVYFFPHDF